MKTPIVSLVETMMTQNTIAASLSGGDMINRAIKVTCFLQREKSPAMGTTVGAIARTWGINEETLRRRVNQLIEMGHIRRDADGLTLLQPSQDESREFFEQIWTLYRDLVLKNLDTAPRTKRRGLPGEMGDPDDVPGPYSANDDAPAFNPEGPSDDEIAGSLHAKRKGPYPV